MTPSRQPSHLTGHPQTAKTLNLMGTGPPRPEACCRSTLCVSSCDCSKASGARAVCQAAAQLSDRQATTQLWKVSNNSRVSTLGRKDVCKQGNKQQTRKQCTHSGGLTLPPLKPTAQLTNPETHQWQASRSLRAVSLSPPPREPAQHRIHQSNLCLYHPDRPLKVQKACSTMPTHMNLHN